MEIDRKWLEMIWNTGSPCNFRVLCPLQVNECLFEDNRFREKTKIEFQSIPFRQNAQIDPGIILCLRQDPNLGLHLLVKY